MQFIQAKALVNIRPELNEDGSEGEIVRAGSMAALQVEELERYVNLGAVEAPPYKFQQPEVEAPVKRGPGRPPNKEGSDA